MVGERLRAAREKAGLTQTALAKRVGTTQSVISQLEDAEYQGHSLSMLRRVAAALKYRLTVRFVPDRTLKKSPKKKK